MKRRSIVALCLVAVVAAAAVVGHDLGRDQEGDCNEHHRLAAGRRADRLAGSSSRQRTSSSSPTIPADGQHPVPELGRSPPEVRRARSRRRRRGPDVIEMGNTEMTKYMAAGAFADLDLVEGLVRQLGQLAHRTRQVGSLPAARRSASRTTRARVSSPTAPTSSRSAGIAKLPATTAQYVADAKKLLAKNPQKGFSPFYVAGDRLVLGDGLRVRLRRRNRTARQRQVEGSARPRRSRSPA